MLGALLDVVLVILNLYTYVIIAAVIVSWLVGFGVINTYNQIARVVVRMLHSLTEPVFGPIRRIVPPLAETKKSADVPWAREEKQIVWPSGDQQGEDSASLVKVSCFRPPPSRSLT